MLAVAITGDKGWPRQLPGSCPRRPFAAGFVRSEASGAGGARRCGGRGEGAVQPQERSGAAPPLPSGESTGPTAACRGFSRFLPSPVQHHHHPHLFLPFSIKRKFVLEVKSQEPVVFLFSKRGRVMPLKRRCPEENRGRNENQLSKMRAQAEVPLSGLSGLPAALPALCTPSASASSARVSAQPRYCFHMFLQEIIGVGSMSSPWSEC